MDDTILLWLTLPGGFAAAAIVAYVAPGLVRRHGRGFRLGVALASGAAAAFAGTTPTGIAWWDAVLAASTAAFLTSLVARAGLRVLTAAAVAAAVLGIGSGGNTIGLLTLGVAVAILLSVRRAPSAASLVAFGLVQAAFRLDLPGPHGASTVGAAAILVPPAVAGFRAMRSRARRRHLRAGAAVAATAVAAASLAAVAFALARPGLERGVARATAGLTAAKGADQEQAAAAFDDAERSFAEAERSVGAWWARPAWLVPIVGPHLRALGAVAETGQELAAGGVRVAGAADLGDLRIRDGVVPIDKLRRLEPELADAADTVTRARARLARTRSTWLLPQVGRRLDTQVERLEDVQGTLESSRDVVHILPAVLGADGPRRYFLAVQTPAELRGTGGFFGSFGEITAVDGKLELARFGRLHELNEGGNPATRKLTGPADYLARYSRFGVANTWQSVTLSPDWPSVTEVIAGLYPQSGGAPIDGAIAVDPAGMAALLKLTGPLTVPGWPVPLTAANTEKILLHDQYVKLPNDERIDFLGDTARTLFNRLTAGELPKPSSILSTLGPAVAQKRIQMASTHAAEQEVYARLHITGAMAPVSGDFLGLITQNASGSKIDYFLHRSIDYRVTVDPVTSKLAATLKATLRNEAPASGLPGYVIGNALEPPLPTGTSRLYVSIYTPWFLRAARVAGVPATVESESELGRNVYSTFVDLPPGGELSIELDLAGWYDGAAYHLGVHRQPTVHPDKVTATINGDDLLDDDIVTDVRATVR
ncbi:MAG TPA: DUF4012 domain-containing protein [Acidimicrobiales bacterium]|nr:DUF4012 domain-containing protein [Acidimicrobiales bacterium]